MEHAASKQNSRRGYTKHGDSYRHGLLKERGIDAIDGRSAAGKRAKKWRAFALNAKGGKLTPIDTREEIDSGTFYLWRALEMRSYIVADARKRGTPINKRRGKLPAINDQHDETMKQWREINDKLKLERLDLARRFMHEANGGQR
jgi:hypothetical protein